MKKICFNLSIIFLFLMISTSNSKADSNCYPDLRTGYFHPITNVFYCNNIGSVNCVVWPCGPPKK